MTGTLVTLIVFAVLAGFAWLFLKSRTQQKQADFERKVQARKLGWSYFNTRDGAIEYRFSGQAHDAAWSMWYDSDRGDDSPTPKAYWQCANLRTPQLALVIIGRKRFRLESGMFGQVLMGVVGGIAHAVSGGSVRPDKAEFYESAVELKVGSAGFLESFSVAVSPDMPRDWLDEEVQRLLMHWPAVGQASEYRSAELIEVTLRQDGLRIVAQRMPEQFAHWKHLAQVGEALTRQLSLRAAANP